jgi:hypothetical protein
LIASVIALVERTHSELRPLRLAAAHPTGDQRDDCDKRAERCDDQRRLQREIGDIQPERHGRSPLSTREAVARARTPRRSRLLSLSSRGGHLGCVEAAILILALGRDLMGEGFRDGRVSDSSSV